ncbi:MAG: hypothetical protein KBA51_09340 [Kiritimatiellae bacterium]|nr:hypothetical protein [Kiritimatiellia bacterium]
MPRYIYRRPEDEGSDYHPYVGARKPPLLSDKKGFRIEMLILVSIALGVAIAFWLVAI